ncbi:hypothetical protein C6501_18910 [Candidatus Poribacteria bacterium]|nr:MAG: hypothetical protein C6501_18910 [Candidatus Poribacteria bacterium]
MNPEHEEHPINAETGKKYGVRGYPAILFVSPDGGLIKYHSGYAPPEKFAPVMEEALKKEAEFQAKLVKLKEMPEDVALNREVGILYLQRQQIEKALPIGQKMPDDVELNREFGIYYLGKKEFDKALLISEKMPDDIKLNNEFTITYLNQGDIEKALPFSKKVFEDDPKNTSGFLPGLHIKLGIAYGNQIRNTAEDVAAENTKMAVMHFQKVIDTYPKSDVFEPAQLYLGITYSISKQYDKSIEVFEKLVNHTTDDRMKQSAEANLKRVKELAAEAAPKSDN